MKKINHSLLLLTLAPALSLVATGCEHVLDHLPTDTSGLPGKEVTTGSASTGNNSNPTWSTGGPGNNGTDFTGGGEGCANPNDPNAPVQIINSDIQGSAKWTCDRIYILDSDSQVVVSGGKLEIEAGTTIRGRAGSALIIEKDAVLEAVGTPDKPIVFTSHRNYNKSRGDWGGLVFLGTAPTNQGVNIPAEGFSLPRTYGGNNPAHNCGTLKYVRVEWAGFALTTDNELNSITFYACGTQTQVDHVQSHMGLDDGIEWFGGGFDASHLVVTGARDDSLDFDLGFQGKLQNIFIHQDPTAGDNAFEISNNSDIATAQPVTLPVLANVTAIGSGINGFGSEGITVKEGAELQLYNSLFVNSTSRALFLSGPTTRQSLANGTTAIAGTLFDSSDKLGPLVLVSNHFGISPAMVEAWLKESSRNNHLREDAELPSLRWTEPSITPSTTSLPATGWVKTPSGLGLLEADYMGAVKPGDANAWVKASWINYSVYP